MSRAPAVALRDVSYSLNGRRILESVNWTVREGEHWAILGPNGAGKTTLLKISCGYLWPNDGGVVYRKGKVLLDLRELRKSIGWVTSTLAPEIPAREKAIRTVVSGRWAQIGLAEAFGGAPTRGDYVRAAKYLEQLGCSSLSEREFGALSQGEQQRVLIARARMARPYVIFLDEPCAGMDPGARESFLASLQALGREKKVPALVYVTHHIEEILPLFKKTLIMKDGKAVQAGETRALLTRKILEELYGVPLRLTMRNGRYWPVAR
jgi:iron complex transport system ATP-binding protein